jgi:oligopeptide transport system substrate-binding protein
VQFQKEGNRGEPFDIADEGWLADYADPYDFINVLLSGENIHDTNNNNFAYFNSPSYNKLMDQAQQLSGSARYNAYGSLDINIMKNAAPWAPRSNATNRLVLSSHVGSFTYNNIYGVDYAAITRK